MNVLHRYSLSRTKGESTYQDTIQKAVCKEERKQHGWQSILLLPSMMLPAGGKPTTLDPSSSLAGTTALAAAIYGPCSIVMS